MAMKKRITEAKTIAKNQKADLNTESNWIFAQSILDATTDWEFMHFYGHTRIKRALLFIYFDESSTDSQWNRRLSFGNRLVRRLAKIAEDQSRLQPGPLHQTQVGWREEVSQCGCH